jgi:competence ComEA-like helix-hairpin-helix protein
MSKLSAEPIKALQTFHNCTLVKTDWADGDSFQIKTETGVLHSIRLYAVDCLELHLRDDRNISRLSDQRKYFGIYEVGKTDSETMKIAFDLAQTAKDFTTKCLEKPFSLHTRFTNGRGDPKFPRIYGFITLADQRDLGTALVQEGLARSVGTLSSMPDGKSLDDSKEMLKDLEIQALKKGRGIWAHTNWDKLPEERQILRKEKAQAKIAEKLNAPSRDFKVNPNTATREELIELKGIEDVLADRIIEERKNAPFKNVDDLLKVKKLTKKTLEKIKHQLVFTDM